MRSLLTLLLSLPLLAQTAPVPLTVTGVKMHVDIHDQYDGHGVPEVKLQNTGEKEITVAAFELTYRDKLDRVTDVVLIEPMKVPGCGHPTLQPGKKCAVWFDHSFLHPYDQVSVRATTVKFSDGTLWEAVKTAQGRVCWSSMITGEGACGAWMPLDQAIKSRDAANFQYSAPLTYRVETKTEAAK